MKTYALFVVVGLALINATTAFADSNTGLKSTPTLSSAPPAQTIVHVAASAKPEVAGASSGCRYKTWEQCVAACGQNLCSWCPHNGKYQCTKKK